MWQYRANSSPADILRGSLTKKLPEVGCDVLQLWFTGDGFVCTEGQAKSSGQFVKAPGTFRSAISHDDSSVFQSPQCFAAAAAAAAAAASFIYKPFDGAGAVWYLVICQKACAQTGLVIQCAVRYIFAI